MGQTVDRNNGTSAIKVLVTSNDQKRKRMFWAHPLFEVFHMTRISVGAPVRAR